MDHDIRLHNPDAAADDGGVDGERALTRGQAKADAAAGRSGQPTAALRDATRSVGYNPRRQAFPRLDASAGGIADAGHHRVELGSRSQEMRWLPRTGPASYMGAGTNSQVLLIGLKPAGRVPSKSPPYSTRSSTDEALYTSTDRTRQRARQRDLWSAQLVSAHRTHPHTH